MLGLKQKIKRSSGRCIRQKGRRDGGAYTEHRKNIDTAGRGGGKAGKVGKTGGEVYGIR